MKPPKFSEDVHPVSDLRRKAHELVSQAQRSRRPVLITQRGRGAAVLVSVAEWESLQEHQELLEAILKGERDFQVGHVLEEETAFARLRAAAVPKSRSR